MEKSFLFFKADNPEWEPDEQGQQFLQHVQQFQQKEQESVFGQQSGIISQQTPEQQPLPEASGSQPGARQQDPKHSMTSSDHRDSAMLNSAMMVSSASSLDQSGGRFHGGGLISVLDKIYESNMANILQ